MFYMNKGLKQTYYSLIAFVLIVTGLAFFCYRLVTFDLPEDRRFLTQATKHTTMGSITDTNGNLIGKGTSVGKETWNPEYSVSLGNLIGPSVLLSRVNSVYSRVYFGDILYGQKENHLTVNDLLDVSGDRIGGTVTLTINADLQKSIYDLLSGSYEDASCAVLNYRTGEILSLVSIPSYDAADESSLHRSEETGAIDDIRAVNKAINELNMPGSSVKPIVFTAALEYDPSLLSEVYTCTGSHTNSYGITVSCPGHHAHGTLTNMASALAVSCNGYAEHIYERLTETAEGRSILSKVIHESGFDRSYTYPGLRFADGVFFGLQSTPEMKTYSIIGGGQCRVTTFGMAAAYGAIANGGMMMEPHLVKSYQVDRFSGEVVTPISESRRLCKEETSASVLGLLEEVTLYGTGQTMALDGFSIASKTGTAVHDNTELETLWAVAVIESDECPYVVALMIDGTNPEVQNSSNTAGVAVHEILKRLTT